MHIEIICAPFNLYNIDLVLFKKIIGVITEITFMDEGVKINCETKKEHKGSPYVITCLLI